MIIDHTYFNSHKVKIGGINTQSYGNDTEETKKIKRDIETFIAEYEPRYLTDLLGDYIAKHIDDYPQIRAMLADDDKKTSPIANYVFFFYMRYNATVSTLAGEKVQSLDSSYTGSLSPKLATVWNDMVDANCRLVDEMKQAKYPIQPKQGSDIFHMVNMYNL